MVVDHDAVTKHAPKHSIKPLCKRGILYYRVNYEGFDFRFHRMWNIYIHDQIHDFINVHVMRHISRGSQILLYVANITAE